MKKIILVGGGITSCITAFLLLNEQVEIEIHEQTAGLGGVLRDFEFENDKFFRGVQYLDVNNIWYKKIEKVFSNELDIFEHTYGCHVNCEGEETYTRNYAVPTFKNIDLNELPDLKKNNFKSSLDRISIYGEKEKSFFLRLMERHNLKADKLNFNSPGALQISRIASLENESEILNLKNKNSTLDKYFAVKRKKLFKEKLLASLPKHGFNEFFLKLQDYLENNGVQIFLKSKIEPEWIGNKLNIIKNGKMINNDYVVWTGNPTKLINKFNGEKLESEYIKMLQISANMISDIPENTYLQIFSDETNITRIYLYKLNGVSKISIEAIFHDVNPNEIMDTAELLLKRFGLNLKINKNNFFKKIDPRFNIVSLKDEKIIENFLLATEKTNLVKSPWLFYGRDQKIAYLYNEIKKFLF